MSEKPLTILAIADLHYTGLARQSSLSPLLCGEYARILLRKVFLRLNHMNVKPDLTIVLGDLLENGNDRNAHLERIALYSELIQSGIPFIAIPGNHDGNSERFTDIFGSNDAMVKVGKYGFVAMLDSYQANHECMRPPEEMERLAILAKKNPNTPIVVCQHPPIYPPIDSHYPYRPVNVGDIIKSFKKAGVVLSLSAHYHRGQKPRMHEDILYHTVPALCEPPFRFSLININDKAIEIKEHNLALSHTTITDVHTHTELAYCSKTTDLATNIGLSQCLGVSSICVTEHAFQLYFDRRYALGFKWQDEVEQVRKVWKTPNRGRMQSYRQLTDKLRSAYVKVGLEVDLYDNGKLLLAPEDNPEQWDILIGAIHAIQGFVPGKTTQQAVEKLFIRDVERITAHDIHVLAHPFRFFRRHGLKMPTHLYPEVADILADSNVAVEINYHTNTPDVDFIRVCLDKGVKVALASDTHDLAETAEFMPHLKLLEDAGVTPQMFQNKLFVPKSITAQDHYL